MRIDKKIEKYLNENIFKKYYDQPNWHEEAGEVAGNAEDLIDRGKKSAAKKYLKSIIKKGVPHWHEEAVQAAEELLYNLIHP